jgi:hypothetical protein
MNMAMWHFEWMCEASVVVEADTEEEAWEIFNDGEIGEAEHTPNAEINCTKMED